MVTDATGIKPADSTSGGIANRQDGTSGGNAPKPSGATESVSTQDDPLVKLQSFIEEYADKKHSKLDKTIRGLTTERDTLRQQVTELMSKLDEFSETSLAKKEQDDLAAAQLDGDPNKVKAVKSYYQIIRDAQTAQDKLRTINAEIESKKDLMVRFNEAGKLAKARELETDTGVSADLILKLFNEQGLTDIEQMENLAETLKPHVVKKGESTTNLPHPDKLQGSTGGKPTEEERLKARYPSMY